MNTNLTIIIIVHLEKLIYFAGMNGKPSNVTETSVSNELFFSGVEQLLAEGKSVRIKAKGRSMEPFIRDGRDEIVLSAGIQARKGCIILARTGEGIVLHRVINIEGNAVTLMGDGNLYKTESCLREDIIAVATRIVRRGKEIDPECFMERLKARIWMVARPYHVPCADLHAEIRQQKLEHHAAGHDTCQYGAGTFP